MYYPKSLDHIPAIKWGIEHEAQAIDEYVKRTGLIVKPTGIWMFKNGIMGASPDGLIFSLPNQSRAEGIIEVKCPYSMRDVYVRNPLDWPKHLKYLDNDAELKQGHDYYHQIQGTMYATRTQWCDFVIWTPHDIHIERIKRDDLWGKNYIYPLEALYQEKLKREENDETTDTEEEYKREAWEGGHGTFGHWNWWGGELKPIRDVNTILSPVGNASHELRYQVVMSMHLHLSRWIYQMHSNSRSGAKWKTAVDRYWNRAVDNICEHCIRKLFKYRWRRFASHEAAKENDDLFIYLMEDERFHWTTLMYDADFARDVRNHVNVYEPSNGLLEPHCMCKPMDFAPPSLKPKELFPKLKIPVQQQLGIIKEESSYILRLIPSPERIKY